MINIVITEAPGVPTKNPEFTETQPVASAGTDNLFADLRSLTINMNVTGGNYEAFKNYLDVLQRHIRLFDVQSFSLDSSAFRPSLDGKPQVGRYAIELVTYYRPH